MRQSTSNSFVRVAIALALTVIVLTAVLGAGGVAADSASTPGAAPPTPAHTDASAAERSATTASPIGEAGVAAETATLTVVDRTDDSITVALSTSAADTMAYAADLTYDDEVVTVEAIDGADFDDPVTNVGDGRVRMTQSTLPAEAVDEPTLATITFAAAGTGETSLSFEDAETIVETPDGEVTPLGTKGLTITVGDENGGSPIGGAPGGTDDETGVATNASGGADTDGDEGDGSTDETAADEETAEADPADDVSEEPVSQDGSPVPGFTATAALVAFLTCLAGRVARRRRRR